MASIGNGLHLHARLRPRATALIDGDERLDYAALDARAAGCAAGLAERGVAAGDRVAIIMGNGLDWAVAHQGALRLGAVPVPLNPRLAPPELAAMLADCAPAAVVAADPAAVAGSGVPTIPAEAPEGRALLDAPAESAPPPTVQPGDTAVILYSSGTTGRPKGVELTHYGLLWNAQAFALDLLRLTPEDRGYGVLPLAHVFGHTCLFVTFLHVGASIVLAPAFDPAETLRDIARHRVSVLMGVPAMYWTLARSDLPDRLDLSSWRACVSGGQALPQDVIADFEARFGVRVSEGYGMTEASPSVCGVRLFDGVRRPGAAGPPFWGVRLRILDPEGNDLPAGERGRIAVSSPGLARGYFRQPELTAKAFRDGWLHTGDVGFLDADGHLHVVDRLTDMIVTGGYNVFPREIEELGHGMDDVLELAAVGAPDPRLGERIVAFMVPRAGRTIDPERVRAVWSEALARYKIPREIRVVDALPRNATGKVDRRRLRRMTEEPR